MRSSERKPVRTHRERSRLSLFAFLAYRSRQAKQCGNVPAGQRAKGMRLLASRRENCMRGISGTGKRLNSLLGQQS